jgi:hypothetical protein
VGGKRWSIAALVALAAGAAASRTGMAAADGRLSTLGRMEVKQVEIGYRPADDGLRVRLHLVSGFAVDHESADPDAAERILAMTQVLASGRARMFVELHQGTVKAFQISVP